MFSPINRVNAKIPSVVIHQKDNTNNVIKTNHTFGKIKEAPFSMPSLGLSHVGNAADAGESIINVTKGRLFIGTDNNLYLFERGAQVPGAIKNASGEWVGIQRNLPGFETTLGGKTVTFEGSEMFLVNKTIRSVGKFADVGGVFISGINYFALGVEGAEVDLFWDSAGALLGWLQPELGIAVWLLQQASEEPGMQERLLKHLAKNRDNSYLSNQAYERELAKYRAIHPLNLQFKPKY